MKTGEVVLLEQILQELKKINAVIDKEQAEAEAFSQPPIPGSPPPPDDSDKDEEKD